MMNDTLYHNVLNMCIEQFGPAGLFVGLFFFGALAIIITGAAAFCLKKVFS